MLFFGLAALCGLATASAARSVLGRRSEPAPAVATVPVVVASEPAPLGQAVDPAKLEVVGWPADAVPQGAFGSPDGLESRVLARSLVKGEPVLESALLPQGAEAGLDSLIAESSRAVSVKVDQVVGVAGFVQPGSKVDVLGTLAGAGKQAATRIILQNVRVLAMDTRVERNRGEAEQVLVATLEVSPRQAEVLTHAENEGAIRLALRNPKDGGESRPVQMVLGTSVHDARF
jgi:pilus assembly protein CpaB